MAAERGHRYGLGIAKGLVVTLVHLLRRPVFTVQYPEERRSLAPRFRGQEFTWYEDRCTACATCAKFCPQGCIEIVSHEPKDQGYHVRWIPDVFTIDTAECILCGICVEVCPYDALRMGSQYEKAQYRRGDLAVDIDELRRAAKRPSTYARPQVEEEGADQSLPWGGKVVY